MKKSRSHGIAETYIHIKYDYNLKKKTHEEIKYYLESHSEEWGRKYFKQQVNITITIEEGSLKAWITVGGLLYAGVTGYGSFRSGIDFMVSDARSFSNYVIEQFYQYEQTQETDIIRDERRLGIPGKIQRLLKKSDKLNISNNRVELIEKLNGELLAILDSLDNENDKEILLQNVPDEII